MTFGASPFDDPAPTTEAPAGNNAPEVHASDTSGTYDHEAFVATFKRGGGYDEPWAVIRGSTAEELKSRIMEFRDSGLAQLISDTADGFCKMSHGGGAPSRQANARPAAQTYNPPPQQTQASGGNSPDACAHGPRVHKEGISKAGKPYSAFFCSSPDRNNQCAPVWGKPPQQTQASGYGEPPF